MTFHMHMHSLHVVLNYERVEILNDRHAYYAQNALYFSINKIISQVEPEPATQVRKYHNTFNLISISTPDYTLIFFWAESLWSNFLKALGC